MKHLGLYFPLKAQMCKTKYTSAKEKANLKDELHWETWQQDTFHDQAN